jgi:hypothetical protein
MFPSIICGAAIAANDQNFLREILALPNRYFEHQFDFRNSLGGQKPSAEFVDVVEKLGHDKAGHTNRSAILRYKTEKRAELGPATTKLVGVEADVLKKAIKFCRVIGFNVREYPIVVTDTLGPNILGLAEGGRIYISRRAFMQGTKIVAGTLIEEFIHLKHGYADETRDMQNFLLDRLVSLGERMEGKPL